MSSGEIAKDREIAIQSEISSLLQQLPEQQRSATLKDILEKQLPKIPETEFNSLRTTFEQEVDRRAMTTESTNPTDSPIENTTQVQSEKLMTLDNSILKRHIFGKFQGQVILHGNEVYPPGYNLMKADDYKEAPAITTQKERNATLDPTGQFSAVNALVRSGLYSQTGTGEIAKKLADCHTLAYLTDPEDPTISRVDMIYPQNLVDRTGRPALAFQVYLTMPTASLNTLLYEINENPDTAEDFYKVATGELDNSVERFKRSKLALVDVEKLIPSNSFKGNVPLHQMVSAYPNRLNPDGINVLPYSKPFGTV